MQGTVLYNFFRSSTSYRVRIALNLKGVAYEYRAVDIVAASGPDQEELDRVNPAGRVPCLVHQDRVLTQSMAIIDYLDRAIPEPLLFPLDLGERAFVMGVCEMVNSDITPLHNIDVLQVLQERFGADVEAQVAWAAHWITQGLHDLEAVLSSSAGKYAIGDNVSAADLFIVPQLHRARRFRVDTGEFPVLAGVERNCLALDAFERAAPERQPDAPQELARPSDALLAPDKSFPG